MTTIFFIPRTRLLQSFAVMLWLQLLLPFSIVSSVKASEASSKNQSQPQPWTCDDMTPNLCDDLQVTEGSVVTQNGLHVHYWHYYDQNSEPSDNSDNKAYPVIVINGGPGMSHDYDLILKQLACGGRDVIFYDQGGTGKSSLPANTTVTEDYPFLLDVDYYANVELPTLLKKLVVFHDGYHIVADSWGTMIALQFAINNKPGNNLKHLALKSLVLIGPVPKASDYHDKAWDPVEGSIPRLPTYFQNRIKAQENSKQFDSEELQNIVQIFMMQIFYRNGILADCFLASLGSANEEITVGMWGEVDFFPVTGTLKDFDVYPQLEMLKDMPAMLSCGEFDMVRPSVLNQMKQHMPLSERLYFPRSGHASLGDVPKDVLDNTHDFLTRVEAALAANLQFSPKELSPNYPKAGVNLAEGSCDTVSMFPWKHWVVLGVMFFVVFGAGYVVGGRAPKHHGYERV